jgi:zinc protease
MKLTSTRPIAFALGLCSVLLPLASFAQLPPWTRFKLDNGLEVLVAENHLTPIVTIEVAVKNGSFTESPEYNGLSHLYEHMFFTSNARDTTEDDFLGRVDDLGIVYNGTTHEELVEYYFTLPKQNLEAGLDFMATSITSPLFKEDELHKQREIVLGEFDRNEALPLFNFGRKVDNALWDGYVSRKEPLGDRQTIRTATREKMLTIKNRYYIPNNSILLISGDVNTAQIRKLIPRYFDRWQKGVDPFIANPPVRAPDLNAPTLVKDTIDDPRAIVFLRWHGPSIGLDDKGTYVADVFSEIIRQPEHPFMKSLEESGLAQSVNFWYYTQRYIGPIQPDIVTTPDRLEETMKTFWQQVAKFDDPNYVTDEELETAKNVLRTRILFSSERLSEFSHEIAFWWAAAGLEYYEHYLSDLSKVTRQDIADYVHRYIQGKPYVLGVAMSKAAFDKYKPSMKSVGNPYYSVRP